MRTIIALAAAAFLVSGAPPQDPPREMPAKVVVHEWGTFTSVAGSDGASLEWRPLSGPSDLPSFVYTTAASPKGFRHGKLCDACGHIKCGCGEKCAGECNCKGCIEATVRMETPVLYFYSDRETTLEVKVGFPKGKITEWYPSARSLRGGIDWGGVRVMPGAEVSPRQQVTWNDYYYARQTDANPVRVCTASEPEYEGFLFYRGVGTFDLPIAVSLEDGGKRVRFRNLGTDPIRPVIVFENRDGKRAYGIYGLAGEKRDLTVGRPVDGDTITYPDLDVEGALKKHLVESGLFEKEASAMIKTWRASWFEPGLRVFYFIPRRMTDALLPLTIDPKPVEVVRTLVGRAEILTPEMEKSIAVQAARLGADSIETRESAMAELRKYGRFAEPVLRKILATTTDPEVKVRIQNLIGG